MISPDLCTEVRFRRYYGGKWKCGPISSHFSGDIWNGQIQVRSESDSLQSSGFDTVDGYPAAYSKCFKSQSYSGKTDRTLCMWFMTWIHELPSPGKVLHSHLIASLEVRNNKCIDSSVLNYFLCARMSGCWFNGLCCKDGSSADVFCKTNYDNWSFLN